MGDIVHLQPWAWVIVYRVTGEPALDEFFDDQKRAEVVADLLRMTTERTIEVRTAFL